MAAHITALPDPPNRGDDQLTFTTKADALLGALPAFVTEANALSDDVEANAASATSSANSASTSASNAAASASAASSASGATPWVNGQTYALNATVVSQLNFQAYRKITASSVTTVDPANDTTNWVKISGVDDLGRFNLTSTTTISNAHRGSIVYCNGSFTLNFDPVATLTNKFWCWIKNSGSGEILLDPSGSEQIDGLTSYIMYPGEARLVQCNASNIVTFVVNPFKVSLTTSGNFIKPPGYKLFGVNAWSGGASGQKSGGGSASGGGGGGFGHFIIPEASIATTQAYVIGAGGAAVTVAANGNLGGNTSMGSIFTVFAGTTFNFGGSIKSGLSAGTPAGFEGSTGATSGVSGSAIDGGGGSQPNNGGSNSIRGAAGGGSVNSGGAVVAPGTSQFAGNGGVAGTATSGADGLAPGGGGGATATGAQSGAGARGQIDIWGIV